MLRSLDNIKMDLSELYEATHCVYENKIGWLAVNNNIWTFSFLKFGGFFFN